MLEAALTDKRLVKLTHLLLAECVIVQISQMADVTNDSLDNPRHGLSGDKQGADLETGLEVMSRQS